MSGFVKNLGAAVARHLAGSLAGLIVLPAVARHLGAEGITAWSLAGTAAFTIGVADLGLSGGVQRAVAAGDEARARLRVEQALGCVFTVGPLLAIGAWKLLEMPSTMNASLADDLRLALPITLVAGLVAAVATPYRGLAMVHGAIASLAWARGLAATLQVALTLVGLAFRASLVAPAVGLLVCAVTETVATIVAARAIDPRVPLAPSLAALRPAAMRVALDEGGATLAINLAYLAALRLDVLILARSCPVAAVAGYAVGSRAVDQSFVVAKQTSAAMLGRLWRPGERARRTIEGTWLIGGVVAAGMAALMHDGRPLLRAWVGPTADADGAAAALVWLGLAATLAGMSEIACATRTLTSKSAWSAARPIVVGSAVNVALSLALVRPLGPSGVAAATAVGNAIVVAWTWRALRREEILDDRETVRALAPIFAVMAVAHAIAWNLSAFANASLVHSIVACAISMGVPLAVAALVLRAKRAPALALEPT